MVIHCIIVIMEKIKKIELDKNNMLCVYPRSKEYAYIYRSAMNVRWNDKEKYLFVDYNYTHQVKDYAYEYALILAAVKDEYNDVLAIDDSTIINNIDIDALK